MKIVHFNSGLGNQIFQYMFSLYWRERGESVYGYYNKKWLRQHNGFEVDRVLQGAVPRATFFSDLIAFLCRALHRFDKKGRFFSSDEIFNEHGIYYSGYWQNKTFYQHLPKPSFKRFDLSEENEKIKELMKNCNSVSVHIRRGDYLDPEIAAKMGNICTLEYYKKSIHKIKELINHPVFFVFSDDIAWARQNIVEQEIHFIDWNVGKNSYLDLYLMAQCKAHIIANSSFSYWGAYMSEENLMTIYPSKWCNEGLSPIIAMDEWVAV